MRNAAALIICFAILFSNFPIAGQAPLTWLLVIAIAIWMLRVGVYPDRPICDVALFSPVVIGVGFILLLAACFFANSQFGPGEVRYLIDWAINFLWIPVIFLLLSHRGLFDIECMRRAAIILTWALALTLVGLMIFLGDVFLLRTPFELPLISQTVLANPNALARTALGILVINQFFLWKSKNDATSNRPHQLVRILLVITIFLTLSRASIAALLLFLLLLGIRSGRFRAYVSLVYSTGIAVFFVVALAGLVTFSEPARDRLQGALDIFSSVQSGTARGPRAKTWIASGKIVRESPILGVGVETARQRLAEHGSLKLRFLPGGRRETIVVAIHGGFLEVLVYGGVVSLLGFLMFYLALLIWSAHNSQSAGSAQSRDAAALLFIYLVILVPLNIAAGNFRDSFTWIVISLLFSLSIKSVRNLRCDSGPRSERFVDARIACP